LGLGLGLGRKVTTQCLVVSDLLSAGGGGACWARGITMFSWPLTVVFL
jgi:hypothetical protein